MKIFTLLALLLWTGGSAQISATPPQRSTPVGSLKPMKANSLMNSTAETYMQIIDYSWYIRGGLSGINLNSLGNAVPNSTENDLLSYKLEYETAGQWSGSIGKQSREPRKRNRVCGCAELHFYRPEPTQNSYL